ncbi:hypothetical protein ACP70R_022333 [Stipagrostis hirtigluma subsp. patula]
MKRAKFVLAQPAVGASHPLAPRPPPSRAAPGPIRGGGEDAEYWASLRYRGLLRDYHALVKETEAKKTRLHMKKLKKQTLLAEVKFLRKRFKSLSQNPSQAMVYRVRNPAMPAYAHTAAWADKVEHRSVHAIGSSSRSQLMQQRQDGPPRGSPVIDLNEACEQSYEDMGIEGLHGHQGPLGIDNTRRYYAMEADVAAGPSDAQMAAFWDARTVAARLGKRKMSWQDQLALRV